jgi:hypothetical protein
MNNYQYSDGKTVIESNTHTNRELQEFIHKADVLYTDDPEFKQVIGAEQDYCLFVSYNNGASLLLCVGSISAINSEIESCIAGQHEASDLIINETVILYRIKS